MKLDLFTESAVLFELELAFTLCVHINLVPIGDIILVFTNRTD